MKLPFFDREIASYHAAALLLGGAAFGSKLLGLLRDRLLAAHFGAGDTLDAYYAAFQIPDILYTVFLIASASAAVLPVFMAVDREGEREARRFIGNLLSVFFVVGLAAIFLAMVFTPWLMQMVAPGFDIEKLDLATRLSRIMLVNTLFLGIAAILSVVLQARQRFLVFALIPMFYNIGIIIGILFFVPIFGPIGLAFGVIAGGALQVLIQLPVLKSLRFVIRPRLDFGDSRLWQVFKTSIPRVIALSMTQITLAVLAAVASFFVSGSISVFKLATNLLYVPVGLFGVSYALAVFPRLSGSSLDNDGRAFRKHLLIGIRNIVFWAFPASALLIVLRAHIVRVVLGSGAFDWTDTRLVAAVLALLALAVFSESVTPLILRAFYAMGRTREPLLWDIAGSVTTILLAFFFGAIFMGHPDILVRLSRALRIGDIVHPQVLGIALAFAIGSIVNLFLLGTSLRRVLQRQFPDGPRFDFAPVSAMLVASVIAGVIAYLSLLPFPSLVPTNTFFGILGQGAVAAVVGFSSYLGILLLQKNQEALALVESFRSRLFTRARATEVFSAEKFDGDATRT